MKKAYQIPTLQITLFETEEILNLSGGSGNGIVVAPPSGGSTEVGGGLDIGW